MENVTITLTTALAAWAITTLIVLIAAAIDGRRSNHTRRLLTALVAQAQDAVTRHQWASGTMGTRDDWIVFERTMENLAQLVQAIGQEAT